MASFHKGGGVLRQKLQGNGAHGDFTFLEAWNIEGSGRTIVRSWKVCDQVQRRWGYGGFIESQQK
jgi:hypothetical protein